MGNSISFDSVLPAMMIARIERLPSKCWVQSESRDQRISFTEDELRLQIPALEPITVLDLWPAQGEQRFEHLTAAMHKLLSRRP